MNVFILAKVQIGSLKLHVLNECIKARQNDNYIISFATYLNNWSMLILNLLFINMFHTFKFIQYILSMHEILKIDRTTKL